MGVTDGAVSRDPLIGRDGGTQEIGGASLAVVFAIVGAVWACVDVALAGGGARACTIAFGSGAAWALLHGLAWVGVATIGGRAGRRAWLVHAGVGLAVAGWLVVELGAIERLGSRNSHLAMVVCLAATAVGAAAVVLAKITAPRGIGDPRWDPGTWTPGRRRGLAGALVVAAVLAAWIDRTQFVGLHPPAHACLRAAGLAGLAIAWQLVRPLRFAGRREPLALLTVLLVAASPFAIVHDDDDAIAVLTAAPPAAEALATLRGLSDLDGDGFSGVLAGGDCAPFDGEIHPAAEDAPDNDVDEDCVGGDARRTIVDPEATPRPTSSARNSVLLVTVETLRADHTSVYGYARDTTPALARRSRDARVYERAFTAGAWTSIAIPTLLRGVYARRLAWVPYAETNKGRLIPAGEAPVLDAGERGIQTFMLPGPSVPPLPWWLARRGMTTAAVVDDRFSELLDPAYGTGLGFDHFVDADAIEGRDPDDRVVDLALQTIAGLPKERAAFVWVHLFGPHSPNTHHDGVPDFGPSLADGYDHEIAFVDAQIDRLIEGMLARDPGAAWIVTADHGEVLLAGDRMHGFDLVPEVVRVPLVIGGAGWPAGRDARLVSTVDLVPTILALTDTPAPTYLDGVDLASPPRDDRIVMVDTWHRRFDGALLFDHAGAIDGEHELVLDITRNAWSGGRVLGDGAPPATATLDRLRAAIVEYLAAVPLAVQ